MDWTETGASPPMLTKPCAASPRVTLRVGLRWIMLESPLTLSAWNVLGAGAMVRAGGVQINLRRTVAGAHPAKSGSGGASPSRYVPLGWAGSSERTLLSAVSARLVEGDVFVDATGDAGDLV